MRQRNRRKVKSISGRKYMARAGFRSINSLMTRSSPRNRRNPKFQSKRKSKTISWTSSPRLLLPTRRRRIWMPFSAPTQANHLHLHRRPRSPSKTRSLSSGSSTRSSLNSISSPSSSNLSRTLTGRQPKGTRAYLGWTHLPISVCLNSSNHS